VTPAQLAPRARRDLLDAARRIAAAPYRFWFLTGFRYVIVYHAERRPPLILRVLHGSRDLAVVLGRR